MTINYAKQIAPYCKHIHAFNWKNEERFSLTKGMEIWEKYLNELTETNTILLEFMPDDKIESLNVEAKALFSITERNEK